jgi:diacylglycerol kinase family enzyme
VQPIIPNKLKYDKKVAVIYNPNSGKKRNVKRLIEKRLSESGISFEFLESEKPF